MTRGYILNPLDTFGIFWDALTANIPKKTTSKFRHVKTPFNDEFLKQISIESLPITCHGKSLNIVTENKGPWNQLIDSPIYKQQEEEEETKEEKKQSSIEAKLAELEIDQQPVTEFKLNDDNFKPPIAETPLNTEQNEDDEEHEDIV